MTFGDHFTKWVAASGPAVSRMTWPRYWNIDRCLILRLFLVAFTIGVAWMPAQPAIEAPLASKSAEIFPNAPAERMPAGAATAPAAFRTYPNARKWWVLSGIALTAASLVDFGTSVGHNEANPTLRSSTGQFSIARGISLKLGTAGAMLLFQALIGRHRPDLYRGITTINVCGAAAFGTAAIHNLDSSALIVR